MRTASPQTEQHSICGLVAREGKKRRGEDGFTFEMGKISSRADRAGNRGERVKGSSRLAKVSFRHTIPRGYKIVTRVRQIAAVRQCLPYVARLVYTPLVTGNSGSPYGR